MITRARQAISDKAFLLLLWVPLFLSSCQQEADTILVPELEVEWSELEMKAGEGLLYRDGEVYSGYSVKYYPNGQMAERIGWWQGKKQGQRQKWFQDGVLSFEAAYEAGKLHGRSRSWWVNGKLRSESNHMAGVAEGIQKVWYISGQPYKEINLKEGREEGFQKAWRKNGKLYVNYEVKNGRQFGLRRSNLCYEVEEGKIPG